MDVKVNEDSFDILKAPSGISTPQWEAITNVESVLDEAKRKIMEERSKDNMKLEDVQPHEVLQASDGEEQEALLHSVEAQLEEREIPGITGYKEKEEEEELYYEELEQELMKLMKQPILTPEDLKDGHSARKMKETLELESEAKKIGEDLIYCMGLRDKYQKISVQLEGDNPKNSSEWEIYPPPPPRAWKDFKKSANIKSSEFNFSECKIPGAQDKRLEYELVSDGGDFDGTYRMYNKDTGETTSDVPGGHQRPNIQSEAACIFTASSGL
ncbi:AMP deaminase [Zancudomyces culisetae]|uniref:AMP deaminase n=1 Tax=Zancudomyces culisetae TaxID=1213189 RepID=A0A1R1PTF0_ZANCU|nr:AMP deaminase [Zancudomyces culisetae]|eukprot:OMH84266.1 AMP deaminase [Zancudomyces culisetae]